MTRASNLYHGFRYSAEVIEHAAWLHHGFSLGLRDVETILAARGTVVSYESIREWRRRNARAAKRFFHKLLRGLQYGLQVIVADTLRPPP